MNVAHLIAGKRDGRTLDDSEIDQLIAGYSRGDVPEYQMAAFAMAVYFQGMNPQETVALTRAMLNSGQPLVWDCPPPKVDKHSTGGIGDKTSIPLAAILAECNVAVPMISGRGLGATGGTLDKLESIPGFRTDLNRQEIRNQVMNIGCVISGASAEIAPADKRLYALRDVTATVPSIPLITASILSKKLSEGLDALILDVKWGSGAFMKTLPAARRLAESLVSVANQLGVPTRALITDMNRPLGTKIGNTLEIDESLEILQGQGPASSAELTCRLAAEALRLAGVAQDVDDGVARVQAAIQSGRALKKFEAFVRAQGGRLEQPRARASARDIHAPNEAYLAAIDCESLGLAIIEMGGGRKVLGDPIDFGVGIEMLCELGEYVTSGQPIARIYSRADRNQDRETIAAAFHWSHTPPVPAPLIVETIG